MVNSFDGTVGLICSIKGWRLLIAQTVAIKRHASVNLVYDSKNLIIGKSEAKVINNRRLRLRYCTVKAKYRQTRCIERLLCD